MDLGKWISRRLALAISGITTVVGSAIADGVITENEFLAITAAVIAAIGAWAYVDKAEKEKK